MKQDLWNPPCRHRARVPGHSQAGDVMPRVDHGARCDAEEVDGRVVI